MEPACSTAATASTALAAQPVKMGDAPPMPPALMFYALPGLIALKAHARIEHLRKIQESAWRPLWAFPTGRWQWTQASQLMRHLSGLIPAHHRTRHRRSRVAVPAAWRPLRKGLHGLSLCWCYSSLRPDEEHARRVWRKSRSITQQIDSAPWTLGSIEEPPFFSAPFCRKLARKKLTSRNSSQ